MDLSRKISPLWGVAASLGFVGSITALYINSTYTPEPIKVLDNASTSFGSLLAANSTNGHQKPEITQQQTINSVSSPARQAWEATDDPERDETCNGIRDYSIGSIKRGTNHLLGSQSQKETDFLYFMNWAAIYGHIQYLHKEFGKDIDACIHPTLFNTEQVKIQKGKAFGLLNADLSVVNTPSIPLLDRYNSWARMDKLMFAPAVVNNNNPIFTTEEMMASIGQSKDSFTAIGQTIGKPIVNTIIIEVQRELSQIVGPIPKDKANILYEKVSTAQEIVARTELKDTRVDYLRMQLQDRPVMRDRAPDGP